MDTKKQLFPEHGILKDNSVVIIDAELDPIYCVFNGDECVTMNTEDYTYIVLSVENLLNLIDFIETTNNN